MADETTTEETEGATSEESETETQETGQPAELGDAGKKALDAERNRAKAAEKRAKTLEQQLDEVRRSQMTEQEKAIDEARAAARAEALSETGAKVAIAEFKAATSGRLDADQLKTLLAGLDLQSFLDGDGDVDADKVQSFVDSIAPTGGNGSTADVGQGARSTMALNGDPLEQALKNKLGIR